jgi:hypothetical protein
VPITTEAGRLIPAHGDWMCFAPVKFVSSTNKITHQDLTKILLKVMLKSMTMGCNGHDHYIW